ncbi:hypothetical protein WBG99_29770 [Streptomyces sp. TG1A-60]
MHESVRREENPVTECVAPAYSGGLDTSVTIGRIAEEIHGRCDPAQGV